MHAMNYISSRCKKQMESAWPSVIHSAPQLQLCPFVNASSETSELKAGTMPLIGVFNVRYTQPHVASKWKFFKSGVIGPKTRDVSWRVTSEWSEPKQPGVGYFSVMSPMPAAHWELAHGRFH